MLLCPVWRWLLCTIRNSFRNSWLPILASITFKLSLLYYCRVNAEKAVTAWKWLTETIYTLYGEPSMVISCLPHILHLRKVLLCCLYFCPWFLLDWERIICQVVHWLWLENAAAYWLRCYRLFHLSADWVLVYRPSCYMWSKLLFRYQTRLIVTFAQMVKPCLGFSFRKFCVKHLKSE